MPPPTLRSVCNPLPVQQAVFCRVQDQRGDPIKLPSRATSRWGEERRTNRGCQPAKHNQQAPVEINPRVWARAVRAQSRLRPCSLPHLPPARVEPRTRTFGERRRPRPRVHGLGAPGPGRRRRLPRAPGGQPACWARRGGHARRSARPASAARCAHRGAARRRGPGPSGEARCEPGGAVRVVGGGGRQAARPPTIAASLKPEPLLRKLKDARILSSVARTPEPRVRTKP